MDKKRILIIEDDVLIRENTKEILELSNYEVVTAENGKIGVKAALERAPDLIVCDIMMQEMDGYGVIYALSKEPRTACIPFIFLSAKAEPSDVRKGMGLGADDYLTKPFEEMDLLQSIDVRLKRSEALLANQPKSSEGLVSFMDQVVNFADLDVLYADRTPREIRAKETVFYNGDTAHYLYFLQQGSVKLVNVNNDGKEFITAMVNKGEFFGYLAIMESKCYNVSAVAMENCEIYRIPRSDYETLMHSDRQVRNAFIRLLADRVYEKELQLLSLAYDSVRKRTATALLSLHKTAESQNQKGFNMNRQDLANIVGTASESVIRTLSDFKEEGAVVIKGKHIEVLRPELLKAIW